MSTMISIHGSHATAKAWHTNHASARLALPDDVGLRFTTAEGALPYVVVSSECELPDATKVAIVDAIEERLGAANSGEPFRQFRWERSPEFGQPPPIFEELTAAARAASQV